DAELVALACDCLAAGRDERPRDAGAVAGRLAGYRAGVQERLRASELARVEAQTRAGGERARRRLAGGPAAPGVAPRAAGGGGAGGGGLGGPGGAGPAWRGGRRPARGPRGSPARPATRRRPTRIAGEPPCRPPAAPRTPWPRSPSPRRGDAWRPCVATSRPAW